MNRRSALGAVATGFAMFGGCLSGSTALDDWDFEDREADAWSYYETNTDVLESPSEQTDEAIETAIHELGDARKIYGDLADEALDRTDEDFDLFTDVNDFFRAMHGLVTAGRNGLMPFVGQDPPGGDDPEPFFKSADDHYYTASEIYKDLDELQDAIDGARFD